MQLEQEMCYFWVPSAITDSENAQGAWLVYWGMVNCKTAEKVRQEKGWFR